MRVILIIGLPLRRKIILAKKNKKKHKVRQYNYYTSSTSSTLYKYEASSKDIHDTAQQVFGATYYIDYDVLTNT